jgi:hypothetical protein
MEWIPFDGGSSVGQRGSENGIILRDEEHEEGARITLEREGFSAPFAITCGIYGWMVHTYFLATEEEATAEYERMKPALADILELIPLTDDPQVDEKVGQVCEAISKFVDRFTEKSSPIRKKTVARKQSTFPGCLAFFKIFSIR